MSDQSPTDPMKLDRLAILLRDDGIDPETMDITQLAQYLQIHKVDMVGSQKRFSAVFKKAKAHQRLEHARARRLEAVAKAKTVLSAGVVAVDALQQKVRGMIEKLGQHDPEQAAVYAREFKKATPEDLKLLEEDLTLLELEDSDDGKGD